MAAGDVNTIIDQKAIQGLIDARKEVVALHEETKKYVQELMKVNEELKQGNVTFTKLIEAQKKVAKSNEKLVGIAKKTIDAEVAMDKQRQKGIESKTKSATATDKEAAAIKKAGLATTKRLGKESLRFKAIRKELEATARVATTAAKKQQAAKDRATVAAKKQEQQEKRLTEAFKREKKSEQDLILITASLTKKRRNLVVTTKKEAAQFKQLTAAIRKNNLALQNSQKQVGLANRSVGKYAQGIKAAALQIAGALGLTAGIALFVRGIGNALGRIKKFDKELQNIAGITGISRDGLKDLESTIIDVAASSIKTANEVAELAATLIVLGKSKDEVIKLLGPVNQLSIALEATSEQAGQLLIKTLNAFGEGNKSAQRFADIIGKMRTSTALDFEQIKDALGFLAPVARVAGISFEKTGAILGVLVDNSIKAAKAGRLTASSFLRLAKKGLTLEDALDKINEAQSRGIKETKLLSLATNLFGVNSGAVGLILANNRDRVAELTKEFENAKGTLDTLTKQQLKSTDAKLKILDSTWEKFILTVDSGRGPISAMITGLVEAATEFIAMITPVKSLADQFREQSDNVDNLTENISPLLDRYDKLSIIVKLSTDEQIELNSIIETIGKTIPTAITQFDEYGKIIGISTVIAEKFIEKQKAMNLIINADAIEEQEKALKKVNTQMERNQRMITEGAKGFTRLGEKIVLTSNDVEDLTLEMEELGKEKLGIEGVLELLKGSFGKELTDAEKLAIVKKKAADKLKSDAEAAQNILDENLAKAKEISEKTAALFFTDQEKQFAAIDKKAEKLRKDGIAEVDIARFVAQEKGKITQELADKRQKLLDKEIDKELKGWDKLLKEKQKLADEALKEEFSLEEEESVSDIADDPKVQAATKRAIEILKIGQSLADKQTDIEEISLNEVQFLLDAGVLNHDQAEALKTDITQKAVDKRQEIMDAAIEFGMAAIDAGFQIYQDNLERESIALQIKLDEDSILLEEQRQNELMQFEGDKEQQAIINEKFDEKQRILDEGFAKKEAALKTKAAKADKAAKVVQAIINTALAVTSAATAPPPVGFILAAIAAALGAVQIATIISQPIPQFFKGTENVPTAGVISIAEKGGEIVEPKTGKAFYVPQPTHLRGLRGAKIHTSEKSQRILDANPQIFVNSGFDSSELKKAYEKSSDKIVKELKRKRGRTKEFENGSILNRRDGGKVFQRHQNVLLGK